MNIICGINPVLEALSAGTRHFDRLLVAKGLRNRRVEEAIRLASQMGIPLRFETRETLDRMAGEVPHQGVVAVVSAKPVMSLETLLEQARSPELVIVLDGVEDPRNLGAILRTAEAAGVDGVLLPERHSAGLSETVARASAGGLEHVRVARVGNVSQALEALKQRGLWVVGYDATAAQRWDGIDYRGPLALVFGGEDRGIRRLVREKCDHLAALPLFGHVGSLNVSVVAGIALYEVIRQRGTVPSHVRPIPPVIETARQHPFAAGPDSWQDGGDAADEETPPLVLVEEHDAAAWAPPSVLRNVGPAGAAHKRPDHRPKGRPPSGGQREHPAPGHSSEPRTQRRRGRRRHRGPGAVPGQPAGAARAETSERPATAGPPPSQDRRPGRRRRRRKRRPPAPSTS